MRRRDARTLEPSQLHWLRQFRSKLKLLTFDLAETHSNDLDKAKSLKEVSKGQQQAPEIAGKP